MTAPFARALRTFAYLALALVACVQAARADDIQIVALGTSFTHGKGVWMSQAYPARLEALLRAEGLPVQVRNQGRDGDTTVDLIRRLDQAVPDGVQIVILEYAVGNDMRAGITMPGTVQNVDTIVSRLRSRRIEVLLLIRGSDPETLQKRTKSFRDVLRRQAIAFEQIEQPRSSLLGDRQHPTADAHGAIAAGMVPSVKRLIERANARPR